MTNINKTALVTGASSGIGAVYANRFALTAVALLALTGTAFADPVQNLHSDAQVTLNAVAPEVDATDLTPIQISRLNSAVASDEGLSRSQVLTIVRR